MTARRPRILFCATTPMNVAVFRPVLDALAADPRLDLSLTARHGARAMVRTLTGPPLPDHLRILGHRHAQMRFTDLAICPGFYYRRGRVGTRVQMFHGVSFKSYAVNEKLRAFDEALVTGEYHHRQLVRAGLDSDCRLRRVGMPKTDPLVRGNLSRDRILRDLGLDPARPTVLYAPTRSSDVGSSLERFGEGVARRLVEVEEANVLIKLHDRSQRRWRTKVAEDWVSRLSDYGDPARVRLVATHDVVPLMAAADLLVSDVSSVTNEFLLRDRPLVYLDLPDHNAWIEKRAVELGEGDLLTWGREPGTVISDPADLPEAIRHGLAHPEEKSEARRRNAALFFDHPGRATEHAVAALYERLILEPPSKAPA